MKKMLFLMKNVKKLDTFWFPRPVFLVLFASHCSLVHPQNEDSPAHRKVT